MVTQGYESSRFLQITIRIHFSKKKFLRLCPVLNLYSARRMLCIGNVPFARIIYLKVDLTLSIQPDLLNH